MNVKGAMVNTTGVSASIKTAATRINQPRRSATPIVASSVLRSTTPGTSAAVVTARSFDSPCPFTDRHTSFGPIDALIVPLRLLALSSQRTHGSNISETVCVIDQIAIAATGAETITAQIKIDETRRTLYSRLTLNEYTFDAHVVTNTRPFATSSPPKCVNSGIAFPLLYSSFPVAASNAYSVDGVQIV
jgi:hypothetical protein